MTKRDDFARQLQPNVIGVVDLVLLTVEDDELKVALFKRDNPDQPAYGSWALPGGEMRPSKDADVQATAERVLKEKAGLEDLYLEQLQVFSGATRDPDRAEGGSWTLCVAYYALVPVQQLQSTTRGDMKLVGVQSLRKLPFDHKEIIDTAVDRVRTKSEYSTLPAYLCPPKFTLRQLRKVYEAIIGRTVDQSNFRRKLAQAQADGGIELVVGEKSRGDANRPADLYRINPRMFGALGTRNRGIFS